MLKRVPSVVQERGSPFEVPFRHSIDGFKGDLNPGPKIWKSYVPKRFR